MIPEGPNPDEGNNLNGNFLCGVVEGFYGKPWSTEQRKKLFKRMKKMGMNTYLYAPKDDCKHRMYWRDLYSVEEADHLTNLIDNAKESSVDFVYALSPGLDITFANSKDVMHLKRKLEQVASFGCKSFALLFDDIEVEMCEADKAVFQSFAHAQLSVSNETYQYLGQPKFLFCPTEYCATRAVPNVATSEYLNTIGAKLLPGIDIMWTGPRVISKKISVESIEEVSKVLQRPPVIWDNIHANDYDPKRVFLGPYDGRLPELIPYLNGVLTNPNCEFEANFVAMHTLAQWSRSNNDGVKRDIVLSSSPVTADIKLETESDNSTEDDDLYLHSSYHPQRALEAAVTDWLEVIHSECREPKRPVPVIKPPVVAAPIGVVGPLIETTAPLTVPTSVPVPIPNLLAQAVRGVDNINELSALAEVNGSLLQPESVGPMNSLIDPTSSDDSEDGSVGEPAVEPMDCVVTPGSSPVSSTILEHARDVVDNFCPDNKSDSSDSTMQVELSSSPLEVSTSIIPATPTTTVTHTPLLTDSHTPTTLTIPTATLTHDEVRQIIDLFYLPLDHGGKSVTLLNDFVWIRSNARAASEARLSAASSSDQEAMLTEWESRCHCFQNNMTALLDVMDRFCEIPNKAVVADLLPYLCDLRETLVMVLSYVRWLGCNKMYRDAFMSGDHEPWFFRGGLQAEFQIKEWQLRHRQVEHVVEDNEHRPRLLGVDGMPDLLHVVPPPVSHCSLLNTNLRPYLPRDECEVYNICSKTYRDGITVAADYPDLVADKQVGSLLALQPELSFVVEDADLQLCAYILAAINAKELSKKANVMWSVAMQTKYPKPDVTDTPSPAQRLMGEFYTERAPLPDCLYQLYPARVSLGLLPQHQNNLSLARRMLLFTFAALKTTGCHGVHVELPRSDPALIDLYAKLGFFDVPVDAAPTNPDDTRVLMARNI